MIVLLEEPEAWSLMMLVSAVAIDNADLSEEGREALRRWRSDHGERTPQLAELTDELNKAMNAHLDAKFMRRVKSKGWYETVKK
jgi:Arc/MetJ-type ribon-helix-helix transcriptional regulator